MGMSQLVTGGSWHRVSGSTGAWMFYPRASSFTRVLPTEVPGKEWFYWGMDVAGWYCWIIFRVHWGGACDVSKGWNFG